MSFLTSPGYFLPDVGFALIPFFISLLVYNLILQGRYRGSGVDLDAELSAAENSAVNVLMVGLFFGLMLAFRGMAFTEEVSLKDQILQIALYAVVAIVLQLVAQVFTDKVILRECMSEMLPETFSIFHSHHLTSLFCQSFHGQDILIHAMMLPEPFTLTLMAGKHFSFDLYHSGDINQG